MTTQAVLTPANRVAAALEATADVDGHSPAESGFALLESNVAFTLGEESNFLALGDFEDCESVVQFDQVVPLHPPGDRLHRHAAGADGLPHEGF